MSGRTARSCNVGPGERVVRGLIAAFAAAFAVSNLDNLWFAIPAGLCAILLGIAAITGWCPTDLLNRTPDEPAEPNTLGYPEARRRLID